MSETNQAAFGKEAGAGLEHDQLPAYAPMLAAYHRAAERELRSIVADLPLREGMRVLDVACGDGDFSRWLAERVGATGRVVGTDLSEAYLERARARAAAGSHSDRIEFRHGDIARLPFAENEFDLVWCAHSLFSLPDPLAALHEMRRVAKPGAYVAVLENDTLHQMLLPWPVELELALRRAQLAALEQQTGASGKFYIGRNLCSAFETAGLENCRVISYTIDRRAPLGDDERTFLEHYLADVFERAEPYLDQAATRAADLLLCPESELYLLNRPGFFMSHIEILAIGSKVEGQRSKVLPLES